MIQPVLLPNGTCALESNSPGEMKLFQDDHNHLTVLAQDMDIWDQELWWHGNQPVKGSQAMYYVVQLQLDSEKKRQSFSKRQDHPYWENLVAISILPDSQITAREL